MARHRSPGTRHAPPAQPYEQRSEQGDHARGARNPAHHTTVIVAVAIAAVIAVIGSMLSFAGALGPPSEADVNLASRDLAVLPTPELPVPELLTPDPEPTTDPAPTSEAPPADEADDKDGQEDGLGEAVARAVRFPAQIIDASKWYLTLPTGPEGHPDTVDTKDLTTYASKWFQLTNAKDGVVFTANAGGATTVNSHYPRSELREMINGENASWDGRSGTHTMEVEEAITKTPATKPDVISAQIHGGDDDVMQIHLSGSRLTVKYADGDKEVVLDPSYKLGERFRVKIQSADGTVKVWFNGAMKATLPINGAGNYFKAGAYVNSNPEKGADPSDVGQVVIYGLKISHTS